MQPLERLEDHRGVFRLEPLAVVADRQPPVAVLMRSFDTNARRFLAPVLESIADKVLEHHC